MFLYNLLLQNVDQAEDSPAASDHGSCTTITCLQAQDHQIHRHILSTTIILKYQTSFLILMISNPSNTDFLKDYIHSTSIIPSKKMFLTEVTTAFKKAAKIL